MNKITVVEEQVETKVSKKVSVFVKPAHDIFEIAELRIQIHKNCDIEFRFSAHDKKWKVIVEVDPNCQFHLYLYQNLVQTKVQYCYQIGKMSQGTVYKLQNAPSKEMVEVHLQAEGASIQYFLKDIVTGKETIDYYIYHDAKETNSSIKNNIVSKEDGSETIQVSTFIPKGMKGCVANQNNRIISNNEKKNEIRPNLYIEEYDVEANHSALIGRFSKEELFYLQSRGISQIDATKLLLQGFLKSDIENSKMQKEIERMIKKEWR